MDIQQIRARLATESGTTFMKEIEIEVLLLILEELQAMHAVLKKMDERSTAW